MTRLSQKDKILSYMRSGKSITTYLAFVKFKITRLPDRIRDLRKDGYGIHDNWKQVNRFTRVKKYWL